MPPRASVIVSASSRGGVLERSLDAFARQSSLEFELIVADFGPGAGSEERVRARAAHFPVRLEHTGRPGAPRAEALNRAVLRSRGEQLIFAPGEAVAAQRFVETHLRARRRGRYGVGGSTLARVGRVTPLGDRPQQHTALLRSALRALGDFLVRPERSSAWALNLSLEREALFRVNGWDERITDTAEQDLNLRKRLGLQGLRPRPLGRGHPL